MSQAHDQKVAQSQIAFALWVKRNYPTLYRVALAQTSAAARSAVSGMGWLGQTSSSSSSGGFWSDLGTNIASLAGDYLNYKSQQNVIQAQQQAQAGQLSLAEITGSSSSSSTMMIVALVGIAAVGGILLFRKKSAK